MRTALGSSLVILGALCSACSPDRTTFPSGQPAFSEDAARLISGSIFQGTGTRSICNGLASGSVLEPRAIGTDGNFFDPEFLTFCPENQFSISVSPGSYLVRVILPADQNLGQRPVRWLEPGAVIVDQSDVTKDIHVRNGSPLQGAATLDGAPVGGVDLQVLYADAPSFGATFGSSGPSGDWAENFGRSPMILQNNLDYLFIGCLGPFAGTKAVEGFPAGPIHFPATDRVDCTLTTGDALQFTHRATRLKLTSLPGDIGGMSDPVIFPEVGFGYSAQFPLAAGAAPHAGPDLVNRQLFRGGLVLGIAPDVTISGTELAGYVACLESTCRALGFNGMAKVRRSGVAREITWEYSDASSAHPRGIQVIQRSFDGRNGADYVLFRFRISNGGTRPLSFTPGVFFDFDVSPELFSNIGYTALGGRLMVTTGQGDMGRHFGTVILEPPPTSRNYFFDGFISQEELVHGLRGDITNPVIGPSDVHGVHGGVPVRLTVGRSSEFWVAVVAGDTRAQIIANARTALEDAQERRAGPALVSSRDELQAIPANARARAGGALRGGRICKAECGPSR
jgi:hypothetical protein